MLGKINLGTQFMLNYFHGDLLQHVSGLRKKIVFSWRLVFLYSTYMTINRKIGCDFPKPKWKAKPDSALGVGMGWNTCLSSFISFSINAAPHLLLPASFPTLAFFLWYFLLPFSLQLKGIILEYQFGFHIRGKMYPFLSCVSCGGRWSILIVQGFPICELTYPLSLICSTKTYTVVFSSNCLWT